METTGSKEKNTKNIKITLEFPDGKIENLESHILCLCLLTDKNEIGQIIHFLGDPLDGLLLSLNLYDAGKKILGELNEEAKNDPQMLSDSLLSKFLEFITTIKEREEATNNTSYEKDWNEHSKEKLC